MALVVTSVNGGEGRVVLGANGRPAHIIELGPVYIRLDVSDGFDTLDLPARGGYCGYVKIGNPQARRRAYRARRVFVGQHGGLNGAHAGGLALGVPA